MIIGYDVPHALVLLVMHAGLTPITRKPLGLAFDLPDLLLAGAVAEAHGFRLVVETDHRTDDEALEEAFAWYPANGNACHCLIGRGAMAAVVPPIPRRPRGFPSLAGAVEWLAPDNQRGQPS